MYKNRDQKRKIQDKTRCLLYSLALFELLFVAPLGGEGNCCHRLCCLLLRCVFSLVFWVRVVLCCKYTCVTLNHPNLPHWLLKKKAFGLGEVRVRVRVRARVRVGVGVRVRVRARVRVGVRVISWCPYTF
jgi:hypothetical protein